MARPLFWSRNCLPVERMKITKQTILVSFITIIFLLLPFFWFKPGEMDLGGDGTRLYFYDPLIYLQHYAFYGVSPSGFGSENMGYFMVPFVLLLAGLKFLFTSSTILIAFFHGISLCVAFIACYGIIKTFLDITNKQRSGLNSLAATVAGIAYIFSPAIYGWDKVIVTHNQFFLNPLIFFLVLRYILTSNYLYLLFSLLITLFFAPNFSFAAAPAFFAFYPLSLLFLFLIQIRVLKKRIIWKHIISFFALFVLLQLFHIIPQVMSMFSSGSVLNTTIFSDEGKFNRGLSYFTAIAPNIKVSLNILNLPQMTVLNYSQYFSLIFPLIIILGLFWNKSKILLLTGIFFLITLFFASANITHIGFALYKKLFDIPGFAMFRNFYGQWAYVLLFYLVILFGQSLAIVLSKLKGFHQQLLSIGLLLLLIISSLPFINGSLVNKMLWQTNSASIFMKMDPSYEEALRFVRSLPVEGKVLTFPLSDPGYQILAGTNNGAYQGPSTISYLGGKQDFAGFNELGVFDKLFESYIKEKKFDELKKLLGMLNIKYIFYNADPKVYDNAFPAFPYTDVRKFLPKTQKEYKAFFNKLGLKQVRVIDNKYYIYEIDEKQYFPRIFTTTDVSYFSTRINDWKLPLSFPKNSSLIFSQETQIPPDSARTFTELSNNAIFPYIIKNPDPAIFLHHAFAKTKPDSLFYSLASIKEYLLLQKQKEGFSYIDGRMFLSAKLLYELELWGSGMPLVGNSRNLDELAIKLKKIEGTRDLKWELHNSQNNWEALLIRYFRNFTESIGYIKTGKEDNMWKVKQKFLIYEYILQHRRRFYDSISGSSKTEKEKMSLDILLDDVFEYLIRELEIPDLSDQRVNYYIPKLELKDDEYFNLFIPSASKYFDQEYVSLNIQGGTLSPLTSSTNDWLGFDVSGLDFSKIDSINLSQNKKKDLMINSTFLSFSNQQEDIAEIIKGSSLVNWKDSLIWKTEELKPRMYYLVRFDYQTGGMPYVIRFFEEKNIKEGKNKSSELNTIFENQVKSRSWARYQAVFQTSEDPRLGFLQIGSDRLHQPFTQIQIKNISIISLPNPKLFLIEEKKNNISRYAPNVSFTKINPTRYSVSVDKTNQSYYLILNQAFNSRWQLLDAKTREKVTKTHLAVNEYANAWYIEPSKLSNKENYSVILEMTTQRYFYIGLLISLATFISIIFYLLYLLFRHEK